VLLSYLVAAGVAALLGGVEQYNSLRTRLTRAEHALLLWGARVLLEAGIGAAGWAIISHAEPAWKHDVLAWIAAGATGPALARARVIDFGEKERATPIGLAMVYEPLRDLISKALKDIGSNAEIDWLYEEVIPGLNRATVPPRLIGDRTKHWIKTCGRFDEPEIVAESNFIEDTLDEAQSDDLRRELIVLRAANLGAYRLVRRLHDSAKSGQLG
jgi:hypothetical protein